LTTVFLDGMALALDALLGDDTTAVQANLAAALPNAGPLGLLAEIAGMEFALDMIQMIANS
jgi:hypothetical protein